MDKIRLKHPLNKPNFGLSGKGQKIATASMAFFASRVTTLLVSFITVPIALQYLGVEQYGLWMAATSFVIMLMAFSDGGVSNALVTATAKASGDDREIRNIIGSAAAILIPLALLIMLGALLVAPLVPWRWVFNLQSDRLANDAQAVILVIVCSVVISFVADIVPRVRTGLQQIPAVKLWDTVAETLALPALLLAVYLKLSMVWLVAAIAITPKLVRAVFSGWFLLQHRAFVPGLRDIELGRSRDLLAGGAVFFMVALTNVLAVQSDQLLIANLVGVEPVTTYTIVQRLFAIPWIFANLIIFSQWPAYSTEVAQENFDWVRRTFMRTLSFVTMFAIVTSLTLFLFHRSILALWVGGAISPSLFLIGGMSAYAILMVIWGTCSMLLIALDARREMIGLNIVMLLVNIPLSILFVLAVGSAGAIWGTVISYLFCLILPSFVIIPRVLNAKQQMQLSSNASIEKFAEGLQDV